MQSGHACPLIADTNAEVGCEIGTGSRFVKWVQDIKHRPELALASASYGRDAEIVCPADRIVAEIAFEFEAQSIGQRVTD